MGLLAHPVLALLLLVVLDNRERRNVLRALQDWSSSRIKHIAARAVKSRRTEFPAASRAEWDSIPVLDVGNLKVAPGLECSLLCAMEDA